MNIKTTKNNLTFKVEPIGAPLTAAAAVAKLCGFAPFAEMSWWLITLPWLLPAYIGLTLFVIIYFVQLFTGRNY